MANHQPSNNVSTLPGRSDIQITVVGQEALLEWNPTGQGKPSNTKLEFKFDLKESSFGGLVDFVKGALGEVPPKEGTIDQPLNCEFVHRLLEAGKLSKIENCTAQDVVLVGAQLADNFKMKNVEIINSHIALKGKLVNLDAVRAKDSTLLIQSEGGTFDNVTLEKGTTFAGDIGATYVAKNCKIQCYAVDMSFKQVIWEGAKEDALGLKERLRGLVFKYDLVNRDIFAPISTALSVAAFKNECIARNNATPIEKVVSALCREPILAQRDISKTPIFSNFSSLYVQETVKLGFEVNAAGNAGKEDTRVFIAELPVVNKDVVLAPSLFYQLRISNSTGTQTQFECIPQKKLCSNVDVIVEALRCYLERAPRELPKSTGWHRRKAKYNPFANGFKVDGEVADPFGYESLFVRETGSGVSVVN